MKALRVYRNAVLKVEDIPEPLVDNNQVRIRVSACGVCGSDIPRIFNNKAHYYPIVLGHEFSGVICGIGKNVQGFNIGDHVVAAPLLPCHKCIDCKKGNYSLCKNYSFIGSSVQGAMAEFVVVPKENIVKLDESINLYDAAMIEPISVVLHGFKQNNFQAGVNVAIIGMGTIGCISVQVAKAKGASHITAFVRNENHNELAKKCGVDTIVNTCNDDWERKVQSITAGRGYDYVFETAGSAQTIIQCFKMAANKAHVCLIGTPKNDVKFTISEWEQINRKEFFLTASWMSYSAPFPGSEWMEAVELLESKMITIYEEMITKIKLNHLTDIKDSINNNKSSRKLIIMG